MASNPNVNKVVYGNQTIMDLTNDDVTPADVAEGKTFHDRSGAQQTGTGNYYSPNDTAETDIANGDYFPFYDTSASGKRKTLWSTIVSAIRNAIITPTPASGKTLSDIRTAMTNANVEGSTNNQVMSLWAVGQWSNTLTKEIIYNGTIAVGDNTIGTWLTSAQLQALSEESDLTVRAASEASYGWWHDDAFVGIDAFDDYRIEFTRKVGKDIITLGGYIIDTDTGYMCVKFGAPTTVAGNKVGVEITVINNGVSYGPN